VADAGGAEDRVGESAARIHLPPGLRRSSNRKIIRMDDRVWRRSRSEMGAMHKPPAVQIAIGPSRIACVGIVAMAVGTFAIMLTLPIIPLAHVGCFIALAAWAGTRIWIVALRRGPRAVREIRLDADRSLVVVHASRATSRGYLREASHVGSDVTTLVWRPTGRRRSRSILILPDTLPADDFRRLRLLMRHSRSAVDAISPASHA
jgi:hypothetical protein